MEATQMQFDHLIIGGGLAGLQLALLIVDDPFFDHLKVGLIEPFDKGENDKTWSFWEKGVGNWDNLCYHQWNQANFRSERESIALDMGDYTYKSIRAIDFYKYAIKRIEESGKIKWIKDSIQEVIQTEHITCQGNQNTYVAQYVYDSRFDFKKLDPKKTQVLQHFKGYIIEAKQSTFDPSTFTMMDYSLPYKEECSFVYILPETDRKALVEYTFFSPDLKKEQKYDQLLQKYIHDFLNLKDYEIVEEELGLIPMTSENLNSSTNKNYIKIGTAGGWVKASSGYSFKRCERFTAQLITNIKEGKKLNHHFSQRRYQLYDRIFLNVLAHNNEIGNQLFQTMYTKNELPMIFKFLDEETTFLEELRIMNRFNHWPFLKGFAREMLLP